MENILIGGKAIGAGRPCYIIAEAGVNHNGKRALAIKLIDAAKKARADAVKFQTYSTDHLVTPLSKKAVYQRKGRSDPESQYEMLKKLELSKEDFTYLAAYAKKKKITFLSTPFDEGSVDFLETLDVPAYKIGSGELTNIPLLRSIACRNKPVILSTGMATLGEIEASLAEMKKAGAQDIILLHCISAYPSDIIIQNLRAITTLQRTFNLPIGFSDHTGGVMAAIIAVSLGAVIVEKHLTLDNSMEGPDHKASLNPSGFARLVQVIRTTEAALGDGIKKPSAAESDIIRTARKSIVAERDVTKGSTITAAMVAIKRPGTGIGPAFLDAVIGKRACRDIKRHTPITWDCIE
jgi:N-acetylneuraminate synthase